MTESLLERSARYIDGAVYGGPRTNNPTDGSFHATRAEVYRVRRDRELSLMARALYLDASRSSEVVSQPVQEPD